MDLNLEEIFGEDEEVLERWLEKSSPPH